MATQTLHNLSEHVSSLIGREKEVAEIQQLLADPQCRLLTLLGPGGIGKTQLAIASATLLSGVADGVFFVPLQPVASTDLLPSVIATATGISLAGSDPLSTQLLRKLHNKELLLLLDNFEHLLAGADLLTALLHEAPAIKLLVTSRESIGVREEWLYPVDGLSVPATDEAGDLAKYSAIHLFSTRARQVRRDFSLQNERDAVISICRQVEGNPLAVELAASWLAVLPCATVATKLRQGRELLASPLRNFPERHRSMDTVFDHSWQLLSQTERETFGRLTLFRGGFTLAAAQAVAGGSLATLSALVFKSLMRREANGRYQMHELLRQYGAEKLAASPEEVTAASSAHATYFLDFLRERRPLFDGRHQLRAVQEIEDEYENVHAALRWAVGHFHTTAQADAIRRAIGPLTSFNQIRSRYLEGAEYLADLIRHFESDERQELCGAILVECLTCFGWLTIRLGRIPEAKEALARALQLDDELNLPLPEYRSGHPLMPSLFLALVLGEFERASILGRELCRLAEQEKQPSALALASYGSASAALAQGDYDEVRHYGEQALLLTESLGIQFLRTHVHDVLGQVAIIQGELEEAKRHFQAAYAICAEYKTPGSMAVHLKNLGDVALRQQLWAEARMMYEQSLDLYRASEDMGGSAAAERGLGIASYSLGDQHKAGYFFRQALAKAVSMQSLRTILSVLAAIGRFMIDQVDAGHRRRLGLRTLRFVALHPSCDKTTYEETVICLNRHKEFHGESQDGAPSDTLEALMATLQTELVAVEISYTMPATPVHPVVVVESLTSREMEVLRLLIKGLSNSEIASILVVTVGTVKTHTSNIYRKLDVINRLQAVTRVRELGLLE